MPDQGFPREKKSWTVSDEQKQIRLDAFVRRCLPHLSRREAENAIAGQFFWINDRPAKKGDRLFNGDRLAWKGPDHWLSEGPLADCNLKVPILHEDAYLLAVDKPAGMAVHGFSGRETDALANFLVAYCPALRAVGTSRWEPGLVHRLDRETSGVVVVAKRQDAFESLRRQFHRGRVHKKYRALVRGVIEEEGTVSFPLVHDPEDRKKMKPLVDPASSTAGGRSWRAATRFRRLAVRGEFSLVEVEMKTGVTHQIRVHLSSIGHPIVGDRLYGGRTAESFGLDRHFLHALCLGFRHPRDGAAITVEAPLAPELVTILERLEMAG